MNEVEGNQIQEKKQAVDLTKEMTGFAHKCNSAPSAVCLKIGDKASMKKTITDRDILLIAELIGDYNPVHMDDDYAAATRFKGRIAHGELITGLISALIGNVLPGHGTIYLSQNVSFLKPARPNDTIAVTVEIVDIAQEKPIMDLEVICENQLGQVILRGHYVVLKETVEK
jgi:acyl dehydratase